MEQYQVEVRGGGDLIKIAEIGKGGGCVPIRA